MKFWDSLPKEIANKFLEIWGLYHFEALSEVLSELKDSWSDLSQHKCLMPFLHRMRGYCQIELNQNLASGIRDYLKCLEYEPDDKQIRKNLDVAASNANDLMQQLFYRQSWKGLKELAESVLEVQKDNGKARWYLGASLDELGDSKSALLIFETLLGEYQNDQNIWRSNVLALIHLNRRAEARVLCERGVSSLSKGGYAFDEVKALLPWIEQLEEESKAEQVTSSECQIH